MGVASIKCFSGNIGYFSIDGTLMGITDVSTTHDGSELIEQSTYEKPGTWHEDSGSSMNISRKERKMGRMNKIHREAWGLQTNLNSNFNELDNIARTRISKLESQVGDLIAESNKDKRTDSLESRIHALEYPMGRIESGSFSRMYFTLQETFQYRYANKVYAIPDIETKNITTFRKKGEYVEIKWEETIDDIPITKTRTFLLKDELIPLDAVYDFGDTPWVEVEK